MIELGTYWLRTATHILMHPSRYLYISALAVFLEVQLIKILNFNQFYSQSYIYFNIILSCSLKNYHNYKFFY